MSDTWLTIRDLFDRACDLPPAEQARFLCALPADQREQLNALLTSDQRDAPTVLNVIQDSAKRLLAPQREHIGSYRVIERLGTGGMGTVYLCERESDYKQRVAIKIVPTIFEHPELLQRLREERQLLADLDHPNIAQLLDGGTTEDGLPYLVMEYVDGMPIDRFCEQQGLGLRARLALFLQVCSAVQYAHQRLIIHRDIKADNILVNADGAVKLLDFGVARLLDRDPATARNSPTLLHMMTPASASPEQLRKEPLTTATDVYSLGVLLYELATGSPPYSLDNASASAIEEAICFEDPVSPHELNREISSDLSQVVMKALHKEAARRYSGAAALTADIRRYLGGFPVQAVPDSRTYVAWKFWRRHRRSLLAAGTLVVLLGILATSTISSRHNLERANLIAQQKSQSTRKAADFLAHTLAQASPFRSGGAPPSVEELLDSSLRDIELGFADEPLLQAMLNTEIAMANAGLGNLDAARDITERVLAQLQAAPRALAANESTRATILLRLTALPLMILDSELSSQLLDEARAIGRALPAPEGLLLLARADFQASQVAFLADAPDGGLNAINRALAHADVRQHDPVLYAEMLSQKGKVLAAYEDALDDGLALMRRGLDLKQASLGGTHPSLLIELDNYATYLVAAPGMLAEIREIAAWQREIVTGSFGPGSIWDSTWQWTTGKAYQMEGRWDLAEASYNQCLSTIFEHGYRGIWAAFIAQDAGYAALMQQKYDKAEKDFRAMLQYAKAGSEGPHWAISEAWLYLSAALYGQGDSDGARRALESYYEGAAKPIDEDRSSAAPFAYLRNDTAFAALTARLNQQL